MIVGTCLANGEGDFEKAKLFGAQAYRLGVDQALQWNEGIDKPYVLLMKGLEKQHTIEKLCDDVMYAYNYLKVKPFLICLSNEQNEAHWLTAANVRRFLPRHFPVPVVIGPKTCCVERAGRKYYSSEDNFDPIGIEVLNYYERPHWEWTSWFENQRRRYRLKSIIKKLRDNGVKRIIITEAHDGSMKRKGMPDHGDYVYQSRKGWDSICKFCDSLCVEVILNYQAPFLGREGNDLL